MLAAGSAKTVFVGSSGWSSLRSLLLHTPSNVASSSLRIHSNSLSRIAGVWAPEARGYATKASIRIPTAKVPAGQASGSGSSSVGSSGTGLGVKSPPSLDLGRDLGLGLAQGGGIRIGGTDSGRGSPLSRWSREGTKWKDLKGGQKVARVFLNSSRFSLILVGAGLTLVISWAVLTELLAKNSPTVIYNDACKRVEANKEIYEHLLPPFRFQVSSSARSSRRAHQVHSTMVSGSNGQADERMLLRFFLLSRDKDTEWGLTDKARQGFWDGVAWCKDAAREGWDKLSDALGLEASEEEIKGGGDSLASQQADGNNGNGAVASFLTAPFRAVGSGMRALVEGTGKPTGMGSLRRNEPGTWSSGEVHAVLEKDENGVYQYRSLYVDVPNSRAALGSRVWIVRKAGEVKR